MSELPSSIHAGSTDTTLAVERLVHYAGPPEAFLAELLSAQCQLAGAAAGAVLRRSENSLECLVQLPENPGSAVAGPTATMLQTAYAADEMLGEADSTAAESSGGGDAQSTPAWLRETGRWLLAHPDLAGPEVLPLQDPDAAWDATARRNAIVLPLNPYTRLDGMACFFLSDASPEQAADACKRLLLTLAVLSLYETRQLLQARSSEVQGLALATSTLGVLNLESRFGSAGLGFCNELSSRFDAERVSFGVVRGRYVRLRSMSHTENVQRKMAVVQAIESAMEECLDQDIEVQHPAAPEEPVIARAAAELARRETCDVVISLPIRRDGEPEAVVTLEKVGRPLSPAEVTFLRLACELCGPRLLEMEAADRWLGARAAESVRRGLRVALGPTHTWAKAAALALLVSALVVTLVEVPFRVDAPFELQAVTRRQVPAPFEGFLASAAVRSGDRVEAGSVLGELDTSELQLQRARLEAERLTHQKEADEARREGQTVDVQIAEAMASEAQVEIDLLTHQIGQATLRAPVGGSVISEDLSQKVFTPVQRGELLFEVARLGQQRAEMRVSDKDIPWISEGMTGSLAPASAPGDPVAFRVDQVEPIAEVVDGENVFRVRLELLETRDWFRPGVAGVAKVDVGRGSILWVYTREAIDFVRLRLWL